MTAVVDLVETFDGPAAFLSNFSAHPVTLDDITYPSAEAAFQAQKNGDRHWQRTVAAAVSPGEAKRMGRAVALRPDWEQVRERAMDRVLAAKFDDASLRERLLATGSALLVEGNSWHDQTWGCCRCPEHASFPGANLLGRALMRLRASLAPRPSTPQWYRVMATGHRPQRLSPASREWVRHSLARVARHLVTAYGMRVAISGGALGTDWWWAEAAHQAGCPFWLYLPHREHTQPWPAHTQADFARLRADAARVAVLGERYSPAVMHRRNAWMARDCDAAVVVHDPRITRGGTVDAIARLQDTVPVIYLDVRHHTIELRQPAR